MPPKRQHLPISRTQEQYPVHLLPRVNPPYPPSAQLGDEIHAIRWWTCGLVIVSQRQQPLARLQLVPLHRHH